MEENHKVEPVIADKEQRTWAMLCHLSALAGFIVPMGSVIGPLIVWLIKKEDMPLVAEHGRKALNFQITMLVAYIVCFILMIVAVGAILLPIVAIFSFVMVVIGAIKTNDGKPFSYPFSINLIK
ncbi:DUF4870 domain-containing protein [Pseudoalteromonas sp. H105]|jgi:uncharacterized protein|uniref:DUF4870 domain-containing protein n=1 Tax=Pseudoalteromonas sp. H105 TaxID=1348393 RepID=UPI000731FDC2|nr:DUF4870 domain-containing protein [Pseudoalteromonas sp. H105]KTF13770.1 orotate phosphoribosyltransferase [Pseudoalteromonas sp. H105]